MKWNIRRIIISGFCTGFHIERCSRVKDEGDRTMWTGVGVLELLGIVKGLG
jgi:hypothetical protein